MINISNQDNIKTVFFFAHPDDEFGAFEKIRRLRIEQEHCLFVFCTKTTTIFKRRKSETLKVLSCFGVREDECIFLSDFADIQDGKAYQHAEILFQIISEILLGLPNLSIVHVPAYEGGHQDHDLLHAVVCLSVHKNDIDTDISEMYLYNNWKAGIIFFRVFKIIEKDSKNIQKLNISRGNQLRYLRYCTLYCSQWRTWLGLLPFVFLHYVLYQHEFHVLLARNSIGHIWQRPHQKPLLYEKRKRCTFQKIQEALRQIK